MNKEEVIQAAIDHYQKQIAKLEKQVAVTRVKAAESPGSMESWSDKSKDEFTQLADGLAKEIEPIKESMKLLKSSKASIPVGIGSLVLLDNGDYYLVVHFAGGEILNVSDKEIFLLSYKSELGKILMRKNVGDQINFRGNNTSVQEIM